jgi:hypothetical protein
MYYRHFLSREFCLNNLDLPKNFAHISLASSKECVFDKDKIAGLKNVKFPVVAKYINTISSDGLSYWLVVLNQHDLSQLTEYFVKKRFYPKPYKFHLTILNRKNIERG